MDVKFVAGLLLLAMVPMTLYALGQATVAVLSLVNVLIVVGSLYLMFGPAEDPHGHATH
jgi:hypothetical protein